jgi:predicted ATPase/DNA-binding CsgD family transcriptional regulator/transcriptional regulator with XRE-family HTH domain
MSTEDLASFGALLRRYRAAAQMTQKHLAERAGLSPSAIAALERGARRPPPAATVELLADALELSDAERADLQATARSLFAVAAADSAAGASTIALDERRPGETRWRHIGWMPLQPTPLVGRTQEVETILRMLTVDGVRLLTLVGPAGVGKTRLAIAAAADAQLADRFPDGVTLVDLAPIRVPQDVLGAIGRAFGFTDTGQLPVGERLRDFLQERALLLVLDNFEQVLPAASSLADLLARCPDLALLVTSRTPLQIRWEQTLRVAPLPVPDLNRALPPLAELAALPSVTLFLQRARARHADFTLTEKQTPLVAHLVAQLDGLPLALELAAARLDVLSLSTLTRRLAHRLELLAVEAPDLPERQRSLEAAVGWSYDLLTKGEQRLFRCLGVFVGRVSLDAIAAVDSVVESGGETGDGEAGDGREAGRTLRQLLSLAEKSLVLPARPEEPDGPEAPAVEPEDDEPALTMLETVREYAEERLAAADELMAARRAHAHYFLALAEQATSQLKGRDQRTWLFRLESEHANLRAALRWLIDQDEDAEREGALRLAGALGWFWFRRGYHAEGWRWLEEALARAPDADLAVRTRALFIAGEILIVLGDVARARVTLEEALTLAQRGQNLATSAAAHTYLGLGAVLAGDAPEGTRLLHEALSRWEGLGDPQSLGVTLFNLGHAVNATGNTATAAAHYAAAVQRLEAAGDAHLAGFVHCYLGVNVWQLGDLPGAVEQVRAGVQTSVAFQDRHLLSFGARVVVALIGERAEPTRRARLLGATEALAQATGAALIWERMPAGQSVLKLRERLASEKEWEAAYRAGRALPFGEVAALALSLLEEVTQGLPDRATALDNARTLERLTQDADRSPLTAREQEVLRLVAQGLSSKAIARQLFIATSTVNYRLTSVFNKLGVDTRAQAVAVAAQRGLL